MDIINKLSDVFSVQSIIPKSLYLSTDDYKMIFAGRGNLIRSFIFGVFPEFSIPRKHREQLLKLHEIISDYELLCRNPSDDINVNVMVTSLYELITVYNKMPSEQYLVEFNHDLDVTVDNFHRYKVLYRFFENKGRVYWSESLENGVSPLYIKHKNGYINNVTVYEALAKEKILRLSRPEESESILNYKLQKQLVEIISRLKNLNPVNLARLNKRELIALLIDTKEFKEIGLHQYFYVLNDGYQECKEWLVKEYNYYRIYWLFNQSLRGSAKDYANVLREIISMGDKRTAKKLANIYTDSISVSDYAVFAFQQEDRERIEKQISKFSA